MSATALLVQVFLDQAISAIQRAQEAKNLTEEEAAKQLPAEQQRSEELKAQLKKN